MKRRIQSFAYAARGIASVARSESNFQIQLVAAAAVTVAGVFFQIAPLEWVVQSLCIGLVLALECVNTSIEKLADQVQPEQDPAIGLIKDAAAGAVLIAAVTSVVTACVLYLPKLSGWLASAMPS